jgi:hypothetical protein
MEHNAFLKIEKSLTICRAPYYLPCERMCVSRIYDDLRNKYGFSDLVWCAAAHDRGGKRRQSFKNGDVTDSRLGEVISGDRLAFWVRALPKYEEEHKQSSKQERREETLMAVPDVVRRVFVGLAIMRGDTCPISLEPFTADEELELLPCWHLFKHRPLSEYGSAAFFAAPERFEYKCPVCRQKYTLSDGARLKSEDLETMRAQMRGA